MSHSLSPKPLSGKCRIPYTCRRRRRCVCQVYICLVEAQQFFFSSLLNCRVMRTMSSTSTIRAICTISSTIGVLRDVVRSDQQSINNVNEDDDDEDGRAGNRPMQLIDLPDDCLHEIIGHFDDIVDVVNLGKTNKRLGQFVQSWYWRSANKSFTFGDEFEWNVTAEVNLHTVLEAMGEYIERVEWHAIRRSQLSVLLANCTVVTNLKLVRVPHRIIQYRTIEGHKWFFQNLRVLKIVNSPIYDCALRLMTHRSTIRTFHLIKCHKVCGRFLNDWRQCMVDDLKIEDCPEMNAKEVVAFLRYVRVKKFVYDGRFDWRWDFKRSSRDSVQQLEILECRQAEGMNRTLAKIIESLPSLNRLIVYSIGRDLLLSIVRVIVEEKRPRLKIGSLRARWNEAERSEMVSD